jgi:hypothetical protein
MRLAVGTKVIRFEVWDFRVPATLILVVEGDDCEKELGVDIRPGLLVGQYLVADNVRFGP